MSGRTFLAVVALLAALLPGAVPAFAAPADKVVVVCDRDVVPYRAFLEGLTAACDCTVQVIPPREAAQPGFEQRLKAAGTRAVVAVGIEAQAAIEGVRDLPVLLTMAPQVGPWVAVQPNRSGVAMFLSPRRHLETLQRVFPQAKRIGLIFDPAQTGDFVREARAAASALGLTLETREIARPGELSRELEEVRGQVDVLWLLPDPTVLQAQNLNLLLLASFESRLPLYGFAKKYVELGAIAAAHLDPAALGAQVAVMLRNPMPVAAAQARWEYADGALLIVNRKVARKMGITLDPAVLEAADDVLR